MDLGRGKMLWLLGQNLNRLRHLHAGLPVQPGFQQTGPPYLAETCPVALAQIRPVARPQPGPTRQTRKLVAGHLLNFFWPTISRGVQGAEPPPCSARQNICAALHNTGSTAQYCLPNPHALS